MKPYIFLIFLGVLSIGCTKKAQTVRQAPVNSENVFRQKNISIQVPTDLRGKTMRLQKQNISFAKGGQLMNGTLICDGCTIEAGPQAIFQNVSLGGDWGGNSAYLEWILGNNFVDAKKNFRILNTLLESGFKINLITIVPIETESNTTVVNPSRNIHLRGNNREKSGLKLMTKHKNWFYNYFQSDKGCNLFLENLSIISDDYAKGITSEVQSEYLLTGSYYQSTFNPGAKPQLDSILVSNCDIRGNIALANYGAHSDNQSKEEFWSKNKIQTMRITNSNFFNSNGPLSFSNMGYGDILIENNKVYDFNTTLIFIPESGLDDSYYEGLRKNKGKIIIRNNVFKNNKPVHVPSGRSLTPFMVKGGQGIMEFNDNTVEDLLATNGDAYALTFYYISKKPGYFSAKNNIIKNVVGRGSLDYPASLIRDRSNTVFYLENNRITIDKEALVKIGVLENINEPLSKIDGNQYNMMFIHIGGQTVFNKEMVIRNNYFSIPYINRSTEIYDVAEFLFENNTINIDYFGPAKVKSTISEDYTFFLGRKRLDLLPGQKAGNFQSINNKITIGQVGEGLFRYVHYPYGSQLGTVDKPDVNYNYDKVSFKDVFNVNNTNIQIDILDGKIQSIEPNILGQNNSLSLVDIANAFTLRANAEKLTSDITIQNADWRGNDYAPFVFIPGSSQQIQVKNHNGNNINILNYIYFISLYNLSKNEDLLVEINFNGIDNQNKALQKRYFLKLHQSGRTFLYENENGLFAEIMPGDNNGRKEVLKNYSLTRVTPNNKVKMIFERGNKHLKDARIFLTNCENIKQYEITCKMYNTGKTKPTQQQFLKQVEEMSSQSMSNDK